MLNKKTKLWIAAVLGILVLAIGLAFLSQKTALFKGLTGFEMPTPDLSGISAAVICESKTTYAACIMAGGCTWIPITSRCTVSQPLPDLSADTTDPTVNFVSPPTPAAGNVSGTVTIKVDADDRGSGIENVKFYIDDTYKHTDSSAPYDYTWNTTNTPNGSHTLRVTARDESGNTRDITRTYTVQNAAPPPAQPDLIIVPNSFSTNTQNPKVGDLVSFQATVKNQGATTVHRFTTRLYIDGQVTSNSDTQMNGLSSNATVNIAAVFNWTASGEGAYTARVCTDTVPEISESDENNNCAEQTFSVGAAAPDSPDAATAPTVNIKVKLDSDASYIDGPLGVQSGSNINLIWAATDATSCNASGDWTGEKNPNGAITSIANITTNKIFTITCINAAGSASDSVTVNIIVPAAINISASLPANQGTTLNPGIQFVKAISIDLAKTEGDNTVDKISGLALALSGDFPKTKLKNEELWVEGVKVNATMAKTPTNDTLTITLPPNYLIAANKKFIFYVKAEVAEVDANRKFQYKVTGVTTDPANMTKTYSGGGTEAAGPEFTVAEAAEELTCANGKTEQGGACACPAGKNEFSGGVTFYTPNVCVPCTTAQLISSGGFYCPQDKPAAPPPPPPPPPPPGGSPPPPPPPPPPETGLQACAAKGKYAYTGPAKPGVRTPGMCIDCPTELYIKLGGKCVEDKKTDDKKAGGSTAGTGGTGGTAGTTKTDSQISGGQAGTTTSAGGAVGAGTRGAAPAPGLGGSQRLVRAPERGQVGPGIAVYFGILAAIQGGIWLKRRLKK